MSNHWQGSNNPGHARRMALQRRIEDEYGEPLRDVIVGLREQGCSWRIASQVLGISYKTLLCWRRQHNLPVDGAYQCDAATLPRRTTTDERAQSLGYRDARNAVAAMRLRGMTVATIGKQLGVCWQHVCYLSPPRVRGLVNISAEGRAALRANMLRVRRKPSADHPWRQDR